MFGAVSAYVMAISAMLFCGVSAITLIYAVNHFDPADPAKGRSSPEEIAESSVA